MTHLITDEGDRITESEGMADLLKKSWEPIWGHVDPDKKIISDYLRDYTKSIDVIPPKDVRRALQDSDVQTQRLLYRSRRHPLLYL